MLDDKYWTAGWAVGKQGLAVSAAKSVFLVSALRATSDLMMVMVMVVIMGIVFICLDLLNICLFVICPSPTIKSNITTYSQKVNRSKRRSLISSSASLRPGKA